MNSAPENIKRCLVIGFSISAVGMASAQTIPDPANPFDVTCSIVSSLEADHSAVKCADGGPPELSFSHSFGSNSSSASKLFDAIIDKFGPSNSVRGNNFVWQIDNPEKQKKQKKTVTIVLTIDPAGDSRIMMDRVEPGTVFASGKKAEKKPNTKENKGKNHNSRPTHNVFKKDDSF